jgi:cytoskeletal protein CcmA (bactofilin family)
MAENLSNTGYRPDAWRVPSAGAVTEHATIGASIVIKGEVSGSEPLFIDGTVEGSVRCPEHRVTIGRNSTIKADIEAREVAVMGSVKGNIHCGDLVDLRAESNIQGEMVTRRIRIDDGAVLKCSVEIHRAERGAQAPEVSKAAPVEAEAKVEANAPEEAATAVAETESAKPHPSKAEVLAAAVARQVPGSSVLFKSVR